MVMNSVLILVMVIIGSLIATNAYVFQQISDVHYSVLVNSVLYNESTLCLDESVYLSKYIQGLNIDIHKENIPHSGLFGRYGCDTNFELFNATTSSMSNYINGDQAPDFVIFTGDAAGHALPYDSWTTSMMTFAKQFSTMYQDTNIAFLPSIGNNDVFPDYNVSCSDNNLEFLSQVWGEWIPESSMNDFKKMGGYVANPAPGLTVIALNTVLYSIKQKNSLGNDPCGQFAWLESQLSTAQQHNSSVYIIGHIFPGLDPFFTEENWKENYIIQFYDLMTTYANTVKAGFFGHIHRDEYRAVDISGPQPATSSTSEPNVMEQDQQQQTESITQEEKTRLGVYGNQFFPLFIGSAISPLYENNPSFKEYQTDDQFNILDINTYYTDIYESNYYGDTNWTLEYSFSDEYQINDYYITGNVLSELTNRFFLNPAMFDRYDDHRTSNYMGDIIITLCLTQASTTETYNNCVNQQTFSLMTSRFKKH